MKEIRFFLFVFLLALNQDTMAFADSVKSETDSRVKRMYGSLHVGFGLKNIAIGSSCTVIFKNNWGVGYSFLSNYYASPNMPKDYRPGNVFLIIPTETPLPIDRMFVYSLLLHKEIATANTRRRFGIAAGPSINYSRSHFFTPTEPDVLLWGLLGATSNYNVTEKKETAYGCTLVSSIGFLTGANVSMQLSAVLNINSQRSFGLIQFEMLFGKIRERQKRKYQRW